MTRRPPAHVAFDYQDIRNDHSRNSGDLYIHITDHDLATAHRGYEGDRLAKALDTKISLLQWMAEEVAMEVSIGTGFPGPEADQTIRVVVFGELPEGKDEAGLRHYALSLYWDLRQAAATARRKATVEARKAS